MRLAVILLASVLLTLPAAGSAPEETQLSSAPPGVVGGRLNVTQRAEPRTLNPLTAVDSVSQEVIGLMTADLIDVDRASFRPVAALASSWTASKGGRLYTLRLRRGIRFSDGHPFDAEDVLFTFRVHLDERINSSQREMLTIGGKPISVRKVDSHTVLFELASPYSGAERLFDNIAILPRHLLEPVYRRGELMKAWPLSTSPAQLAGLGPFRLKEYLAGERIVFQKNPHYWKVDALGHRLPYLDEIVFQFVGSEDAQVLRFEPGQAHLLAGIGPDNYAVLQEGQKRSRYRLIDLGPGLEYTFLVFNQNQLGPDASLTLREKQSWFRHTAFRQALSLAIDREAIVQLVYRGRAAPIWAHVTEGNKEWVNHSISRTPRSLDGARDLLRRAGYVWDATGRLLDANGKEVAFSVLTSAGNSQRSQIATIIQDDLKQLGIRAGVITLEFRSMLDRVFRSYDYEAALMTLASGDTDPNAEMNVWTSRGNARVWNLNGAAATDWEREIDELMRKQLTVMNRQERKRYYDRVQQLIATNLPVICLVSPHVLLAAAQGLENVQPSILRPYALWNADQLYFRQDNAAIRTK
jgi:peptide/nickel transport system substrate-binding protein